MKSNHSLVRLLTAGVIFSVSFSLRADDTNSSSTSAPQPAWEAQSATNDQGLHYDQPDYYRSNEFALDLFGTASLGQYSIEHWSGSRVRNDTQFGAGVGLSYFITRYVGIGAEGYSENTTRTLVDSASANLKFRLPLGESGFAPYAFGGGGHQFDQTRFWFGQAGAGMEFRFTPHMGVFVDARGVVPNETKYYGIARLGLRIAF